MGLLLTKTENWDEIRSVVRECFSGDNDLVDRYHIKAGTCVEECVEDTYNVLINHTHEDFTFYKVLDSDRLAGFIGVEPSANYLTTFCLKKEFRNEQNKDELLSLAKSILGDNFSCALYAKNERAINYLIKQGLEKTSDGVYGDEPIVILNYLKKEELCL